MRSWKKKSSASNHRWWLWERKSHRKMPVGRTKGPLKNNFTELAPRFASDSVATD